MTNIYPIYIQYNQKKGGYRGIFREDAEDTGTYFRGNHGSKVSKSQKCEKKMYFPHTRTSWDKYMFNGIPKLKFKDGSELVQLRGKIY